MATIKSQLKLIILFLFLSESGKDIVIYLPSPIFSKLTGKASNGYVVTKVDLSY